MTFSTLLMRAEARVNIEADDARKWFLGLKTNPEDYNFSSHLGFYFTEGNFGEIDSRFYTKERFYGIMLKLSFRLTERSANSFTIALHKPIRNIDGTFAISKVDESITRIDLSLFARTKPIYRLFQIRPLYEAVQEQINSEVQHIKAAMESRSLNLQA